MFATLKRMAKWSPIKSNDSQKSQSSLLLSCFIGLLEEILFWRSKWISIVFILFVNLVFFVCVYRQISFIPFVCSLCITAICMDAIETWLKYKHRTSCLKQLARQDGAELKSVLSRIWSWLDKKITELLHLRETNHTKAFLIVNIILGSVLLVGMYVNGYLITYVICMTICILHKIAPPVFKALKALHQHAESDAEFEGLIPEVSDANIKLLSIEPEVTKDFDEAQSLDFWKPVDQPLEEASDDSSETSATLVTLSKDKMHTLDKDVDTSDSSDEEYIPLVQQKEQLQSTLEVIQPASTWSSSAYNAFFSLTGAVANMVYASPDDNKKKRVSRDSSDGFEMIDKSDLN